MNPSETVIVIRSLVPGGVAQQDGRLIPGDRLISVNDVNLENASLDIAVGALKGAPKGTVRIAVAKPLPLPECNSHHQVSQSVQFVGGQANLSLNQNNQMSQYSNQRPQPGHGHGYEEQSGPRYARFPPVLPPNNF